MAKGFFIKDEIKEHYKKHSKYYFIAMCFIVVGIVVGIVLMYSDFNYMSILKINLGILTTKNKSYN